MICVCFLEILMWNRLHYTQALSEPYLVTRLPSTMTTTNDHVTVALKGEPYLKVLLFNKVEDKRN